jgi:hypothetical protein
MSGMMIIGCTVGVLLIVLLIVIIWKLLKK